LLISARLMAEIRVSGSNFGVLGRIFAVPVGSGRVSAVIYAGGRPIEVENDQDRGDRVRRALQSGQGRG
jgi:hypothetical protein